MRALPSDVRVISCERQIKVEVVGLEVVESLRGLANVGGQSKPVDEPTPNKVFHLLSCQAIFRFVLIGSSPCWNFECASFVEVGGRSNLVDSPQLGHWNSVSNRDALNSIRRDNDVSNETIIPGDRRSLGLSYDKIAPVDVLTPTLCSFLKLSSLFFVGIDLTRVRLVFSRAFGTGGESHAAMTKTRTATWRQITRGQSL